MQLAEHFRSKRVLVTGGLGFIGSNLARRLVDAGADVLLVDNLFPEYGGNRFNIAGLESRVCVCISDVRDEREMQAHVRNQDFIFNLAGQTSHLDSMENPRADLEINCAAQLSILEACRANNPAVKLVFASTRQIYGRPQYLPVDEKHPLNPVDVNGINKMAGEFYHRLYNNVHGLRACVMRLTNTIGPRMRVRDARQTFVGVWIRQLLEGKPIEVWGGEQLRDFNFVDDVVDALLLAAASEKGNGDVFNLGSSEVVSLKQLAQSLVELNGSGSFAVKEFPADRKVIDIGDYYSDYKHFHATFGWTPRTPLREALANTLEFYKENLKHYV
jgi:nucleoside-diphosphate-sugar epimerase